MTIRTQTLLMVTVLLAAAVAATAGAVGWSSRRALLAETGTQGVAIARLVARSAAFGAQVMRDVEDAVGEQMVVEATMAAHLVALGEAAGVSRPALTRRLQQIVAETVLDEIWVTDEKGHAYLRNLAEVDFTFSPDPDAQPQAHAFWALLTGQERTVIQEARQREVDTQVFKYVGVTGVDQPRIVQVGYHATLLEQLRQRMGLTRLIDELVSDGSVLAIRVLDRSLNTVDYAEQLREGARPEPTASERAHLLRLPEAGRTQSFLEGSRLKVVVPISEEVGELTGGAILVTLPTDHVQAAIHSQTRLAMAVSGLVLVLGSAIALGGARSISRPIVDLTEMTGRIAAGDFTRRIDIRAANEIGTLAASFNEMTRRLNESVEDLKETTAAKERIEHELQIAHDIQMSMVPKTFPPFPDRREFDVFATLVPARSVGGDLYDFFFIDDDRFCFAVADVSGKGVPASLFMAVTKALFRATAVSGIAPGDILARLNAEICRDNESFMFVTFFCGILNVRTGELDYSNGGHNLPYHLDRDGARPLENIGGGALGILAQNAYVSGRMVLAPGDALLLYTDGVTESMDPGGTLYSDQRLAQFLTRRRSLAPRQLVGELIGDLRRHAGAAAQSDDITVLALRYLRATGAATGTRLTFRNRKSEIARLHPALAAFGQQYGLAPRTVHDLNLALEEILVNTISYGYTDDREHEIQVRLAVRAGEVRVDVEDDGRPFNPLEAPVPDTTKPLGERTVGGLGIHFVRTLMDGLEYRREGDRNLLSFSKKT